MAILSTKRAKKKISSKAKVNANTKANTQFDIYFMRMAIKLGFKHLIPRFDQAHTYSDNIRLHLDIVEVDKNAPTIVFIPGTAVYALCYAEFMVQLADGGYNVIGFDPRGHGRSGGKRGDYTVEELMRDTQAVITYAIENYSDEVSLVGSSQGGITAFYVAAIDDRVKTAVCQNFADLGDPSSTQLSRIPWLVKFTKPAFVPLAQLFPQFKIPISAYINLSKEKVKYFGNVQKFLDIDPYTLKSVRLRTLKSLATTPVPCPIEKIKTPIMVIQPGLDNIFPVKYTKRLFRKLTCKKRLQIFTSYTHTLLFDNAIEVSPAVLNWLNEVHQIA